MAKKQRFYVVWKGHTPGIYDSWADCQRQIMHFAGAVYKAFDSRAAASKALSEGPANYVGAAGKPAKKKTEFVSKAGIIHHSIAVDAACSGNPGVMEYQGVYTKNGKQLFHKKYSLGTNNIGEFLAIVHALAYCKKEGVNLPIYTDSKTAIKWVQTKKCKTQLEANAQTAALMEVIHRAEEWLKKNTWDNPLLKWETESWGEIPADFGRK